MVRAVLWGSASTLVMSAIIWFGWFEPRSLAETGEHLYPPVQLPAAVTSDPKAGAVVGDGATRQVALVMPHEVDAAVDSEPVRPPALELLPDLRIRPPSDVALIGSRSGGTLRLKFTTLIWNDGDGPVEVRGSQNTETELQVVQYVHRENGMPLADRAIGEFDFEHRHGHLHLGGFARYELWSLDDEGRPIEIVARNAKVGFCLMDNVPVDALTAPSEPVYDDCDAEVQGISVGYGDVYVAALYEQDLNVSHVPAGRYRLVNIANPDHAVRELDHSNNSAHRDMVISGESVALAGP